MLINKPIFSDIQGNTIWVSNVLQADQNVGFRNFSAKYVVAGNENYTINNRKFALHQGEYVIGNKSVSSRVHIDSKAPVKGICLDVSKEIISEIIDYRFENPSMFSDFLFNQEWVTQKYSEKNTTLGYALHQLSNELSNGINSQYSIHKELFYAIAECIVADQSLAYSDFKQLKAVKNETNGHLFNFLYDAKNYIDANFLESLRIEDISKESKISEYHFIRQFKTVFKMTPYKYVIKKRLEYALELINNNFSMTEISDILGYTDLAAFSKAFKSFHGVSPKNYPSAN